MLGGASEYTRALCRISVAGLRRAAPPTFAVLMIISLLLADGLFPVFASKYRPEAPLQSSSSLGRSASGDRYADDVVYSRISSNSNSRYRTKVGLKPFLPRRGDASMSAGTGGQSSKLTRPHPQLNDQDTSRRGQTEVAGERPGVRENERRDRVEVSSRLDRAGATFGLGSLPFSLTSSSSGSSYVKSLSPVLSSSISSPSSLSISNSSNSNRDHNPGYIFHDRTLPNGPDMNTCPGHHPSAPSSSPGECSSLLNKNQCLTLTSGLAEAVCRTCQPRDRASVLVSSRLRFCSSFRVASVSCASGVAEGAACPLNESPSTCLQYLQDIIASDDLVDSRYQGFKGLIGRYDCSSNYSVKWRCRHCEQAYKDWLCSQTIKFFQSSQIVLPCMDFCSHVEEMCPFFRPKLESYAGDHSFICKDPHMKLPSTIPERDCYGLCNLWSKSQISDFYCSHGVQADTNCPWLQNCDLTIPREIMNQSNHSNNSTSGVNAMYTSSRTSSLFILQIFCTVLASLLRLPLTELQSLSPGLT